MPVSVPALQLLKLSVINQLFLTGRTPNYSHPPPISWGDVRVLLVRSLIPVKSSSAMKVNVLITTDLAIFDHRGLKLPAIPPYAQRSGVGTPAI